jgi:hypothetical protein
MSASSPPPPPHIFLTHSCILQSYPKASKFQRQAFPLYDDLEKLYGGKLSLLKFLLSWSPELFIAVKLCHFPGVVVWGIGIL